MPTAVFCSGVLHHKWPCNVYIDVGCGAWLASVTGKMLGERESLPHGAESAWVPLRGKAPAEGSAQTLWVCGATAVHTAMCKCMGFADHRSHSLLHQVCAGSGSMSPSLPDAGGGAPCPAPGVLLLAHPAALRVSWGTGVAVGGRRG